MLSSSSAVQFNTAQTTTHTAFAKHQNVNFWLNCGDFVETWGGTNYAEWEWEQFFETQQDLLLKTPFAPVQGNHDVSPRNNFKSHFHTEDFPTDPQGSTYSFSYGDALFFALNGELYNNTNYINDVKIWMQDIVENPQNQDIKWRIVYYHKSIFTGGNHQASPEVTAWRNAMATFFEDLNIDIAFQGHTHVYEVLGPIVSEVLGTKTNYTIVPGAVSNVQNVQKECSQRLNISGKIGGIFNVKEGTLYFLNSSSRGPKEPFCFNEMNCCSDIQDYPSLFTGRLGKTEKPTYSHVTVSSNMVVISTYEVLSAGNTRLYDEIIVVKNNCQTTTNCGDCSFDNLTFSNNQTLTNVNFVITDELRIKNNATVTFTNSTLRFYENAKVIIEPGSKLIIDGTTLTNACPNKLWQGILVTGDYCKSQTPANQGVLELKNGATIKNARNAISTSNIKPNGIPAYEEAGGIIYADNATFYNNRRSVEFLSYPNLACIGNIRIAQNVSYFKNCNFIVDDNNFFAANNTSFSHHITLWGVSGVKIYGCKFENNISTYMSDRGNAIYTESAGFLVDELCNLVDVTSLCGDCKILGSASIFKGFNKAIESYITGNQYAIKVDRSQFQDNSIGVRIATHNTLQITRSDMELKSTQTGIFLDECTGYKVEQNTIGSNIANSATGIWVHRAGVDENKIYRNDIQKLHTALKVTEYTTQPFRAGGYNSTGLQFLCNELSDNYYDIDIISPGRIRTPQGSSGCGADNMFSPTANKHFLTSNVTQRVDYYYDTSVPRKKPVNNSSMVTLFPATANPCKSTLCKGEPSGGGGTNGKGGSESLLAEYKKLNRKYAELLTIFHEKGYDKILHDYSNGIIENEELLKEALQFHETMASTTETMSELSHEALFALKTDSIIDLNQIRDWYDEMYNLSAKYSLAETYYQLGKYEEGFKTLTSIPRMYALTEEEMIEHQNYVSLFTFKNQIKESGRNIAQLNEEEIKQLLHIAHASNGLSSVMARGILCFFYEICLDDERMRGLADEMMRRLDDEVINLRESVASVCKKDLKNIKIYPNPATGELQITNYELRVLGVEIFDIFGKKLSSHKFITPSSHHFINISHLNTGEYFVKITTEQGVISKKIIKQ